MNMRWSAVNQNDNKRRNSFGAKISVSFFMTINNLCEEAVQKTKYVSISDRRI